VQHDSDVLPIPPIIYTAVEKVQNLAWILSCSRSEMEWQIWDLKQTCKLTMIVLCTASTCRHGSRIKIRGGVQAAGCTSFPFILLFPTFPYLWLSLHLPSLPALSSIPFPLPSRFTSLWGLTQSSYNVCRK